MELIKSKGFILFAVIVIGFSIITTPNVKTKDEERKIDDSYVYSEIKDSKLF